MLVTTRIYHAINNRIPISVKDAPAIACFMTKLKTWLLDELFYDIDEYIFL